MHVHVHVLVLVHVHVHVLPSLCCQHVLPSLCCHRVWSGLKTVLVAGLQASPLRSLLIYKLRARCWLLVYNHLVSVHELVARLTASRFVAWRMACLALPETSSLARPTPLVSFVSLCSLSLALDNVNSCLSWATKAERDAGHVLILGSTSSNAHALIGYSSDFPRPPTSLDLSSILP